MNPHACICAHCNVTLRPGTLPASHTICADCLRRDFPELADAVLARLEGPR